MKIEDALKVNLAGLELEHPIINAAGTCKYLTDDELSVKGLAKSSIAAIMVGSITFTGCEGNPGEVYRSTGNLSINSRGLLNPGWYYYYLKNLPLMIRLTHESHKLFFLSVVGHPDECARMTGGAFELGVDLVELNLSCPNVWRNGHQEKIPCYYPELVAEILDAVTQEVGEDPIIAVKLSPLFDSVLLATVAGVIKTHKAVKVVTAINSIPNGLIYGEDGKPLLSSPKGLGGLAGPSIKPIGLGQVAQLRELLPKRISIIGVGGIEKGRDILDYQRAGADAVQVGTLLFNKGLSGLRLLDDLIAEWYKRGAE